MATPISDRYRRYKVGTSKVTGWLKSAAKRCAGVGEALANLCIADDDASSSEKLSTKDLIELANTIATSSQPKVEIPLEILVITEDVITGRRACAEWYAGTENQAINEETHDSNQRHRKFIEVLEQVLHVLKEKYEQRLPKSFKKKPEKLDQLKAELFDNIYQYLELEQPTAVADDLEQSTGGNTTPAPSSRHAKPKQSLAADIEEADKTFALWCFFKDQYDTCNFIKDAWEEFSDGKLTLTAVAQLTDTAIMLMHKASDSLVAEYPEFNDMNGVERFLGFAKMTVGGQLTVMAFREKKIRYDAHSKPALHELFFTKAACFMQDFRELCCNSDVKHPKATLNLSHLFAGSLHAIVPEIRLLAACKNHQEIHHEDQFLHGLVLSLGRHARLPPWLVTACQIYMYIYDVLDVQMIQGHEELHNVGPVLGKSMWDHANYMESFSDWNWPAMMPVALDFFRNNMMKQVEQESIHVCQSDFPVEELRGPSPDYHLQKLLPVTSGSLLFITQQCAHVCGILDCNTGFIVLAAAHLYKAARLSGALTVEWKDMEVGDPSIIRPYVRRRLLTCYSGSLGSTANSGRSFLTSVTPRNHSQHLRSTIIWRLV